jgi:orotidine-5'-phosphate decarboxylase
VTGGGRSRLIVALDYPTAALALAQVDALGERVELYKVGLELYLASGRTIVEALRQRGKRLFVDLKLHDIPETVARAMRTLVADGGIELVTVHTAGGREMMARAADEAHRAGAKVLGVTVLTSLDQVDLAGDGVAIPLGDLALRRARLARESGLDGVVASPHEAAAIRGAVGTELLVVTPGVRLDSAGGDDQKRTATARQARLHGADYVVVGRPIRDAADPCAVVDALVSQLEVDPAAALLASDVERTPFQGAIPVEESR